MAKISGVCIERSERSVRSVLSSSTPSSGMRLQVDVNLSAITTKIIVPIPFQVRQNLWSVVHPSFYQYQDDLETPLCSNSSPGSCVSFACGRRRRQQPETLQRQAGPSGKDRLRRHSANDMRVQTLESLLYSSIYYIFH